MTTGTGTVWIIGLRLHDSQRSCSEFHIAADIAVVCNTTQHLLVELRNQTRYASHTLSLEASSVLHDGVSVVNGPLPPLTHPLRPPASTLVSRQWPDEFCPRPLRQVQVVLWSWFPVSNRWVWCLQDGTMLPKVVTITIISIIISTIIISPVSVLLFRVFCLCVVDGVF